MLPGQLATGRLQPLGEAAQPRTVQGRRMLLGIVVAYAQTGVAVGMR
ncbi:hypothetical protein ACFZAV_34910 [Streptomyces sp. NPDC008343]